MSKRNQAKIKALWKQGRNVWEISQITGQSEIDVLREVRSL